MICFNTIAKHFKWADEGRKAPYSARSTPKSARSAKSTGSNKSAAAPKEDGPRQILNAENVQTFIYKYIEAHLKTEKLWLHVSSEF